MSVSNITKHAGSVQLSVQLARGAVAAALVCAAGATCAATPGITAATAPTTLPAGAPAGSTFYLSATPNYISQPDGAQIYSWGYGCTGGTAAATFAPAQFNALVNGAKLGFCGTMQVPGPTLIVTENVAFTVTLINALPAGAGNTSIVFPGLKVTAVSGGVTGALAQEATPGSSVTYTVVATSPGTRAYYSGTQPDLQIEMGLYGAVVVLPSTPVGATGSTVAATGHGTGTTAGNGCFALGSELGGRDDFRLASSALDNLASSCYDREYLFQFMELDPSIHKQAELQAAAIAACPAGSHNALTGQPCPLATLFVATEPYHPAYFLINGRSMPDDMDADYAPNYPNQPYNGNPHMHPGELVLIRVIGQGRLEHPFHEHGNHVRILARDGGAMPSQTNATLLAGRMEFTTDTYPGQTFDGIFYWSGRGLGWDIYGHTPLISSAFIYAVTQCPSAPATATACPATTAATATATAYTSTPLDLGTGVTSCSGASCPIVTIAGIPAYNGTYKLLSVAPTYPPGYPNCAPTTACSQVGTVFTFTAPSNLPIYQYVGSAAATASTVASSQAGIDPQLNPTCAADPNGYYTTATGAAPPTYSGTTMTSGATNYFEWCADHDHPLETNPVGQVGGGGPATLPDPMVMTNGLWYNGTPYLGPNAVNRSRGPTPLPPGGALQNPPAESGIAFMWHSHNEREITTNDVFPGGMLMMMLVDPYVWYIDETL